ncbi:MAG TPA: UDP-3-O-(3-hydroxymyristoyl)glucosamine N-acyltransferase [Armatimonadota bacterium]|nr:UDP-3-O-(3-hydroxymyristoyl)glucosamine N-acyltransferase [Armatimonadota bacterium]
MPALTLEQLAQKLGGEAVGPGELVIAGVSSYESAGGSDLAFVDSPRLLPLAERSRAAALIVPREIVSAAKPIIRADNPRLAFAQALDLFSPRRRPLPGVHPTTVMGADVEMAEGVYVGPYVVLGSGVRLGRGVELHALTFIGDNVEVGADTVLYPRVSVYHDVRIGARCIIHSGCVIGGDGFGFVQGACGERVKMPQVGTVLIEDEVEIGANCAIDRATTDATTIGRGTKIDNLVQIGHNVNIGRNCIIVAQVGLSGSVQVGDGAVLAGQAGVADHVTIGAGAKLCAQTGATGDVPADTVVSGFPARPHKERLKIEASLRKLPDALAELRALRRRVQELEERLQRGDAPDSG